MAEKSKPESSNQENKSGLSLPAFEDGWMKPVGSIRSKSGGCNVLIIAPHGFPGDDDNTEILGYYLAENKSLRSYAVINNRKYSKPPKENGVEKPDPDANRMNLNREKQALECSDFMDPILSALKGIHSKFPDSPPIVLFLHGMDDDAAQKRKSAMQIEVGAACESLESWDTDKETATKEFAEKLIGGLTASFGPGSADYLGHFTGSGTTLAYFRKNLDFPVNAIQLEFRYAGFRDTVENIQSTAGKPASMIPSLPGFKRFNVPFFETRLVDSIITEDRHRKDDGDLEPLKDSIQRVGLLHPAVITSKNKLIAGGRRLAAFKELGRTEIPVHVVDLENLVEGEFDENAVRKPFTPSEAVAIAKEVKPILAERAKQRLSDAGRLGGKTAGKGRQRKQGAEKFADPYKGNTRDMIAAITGMSHTSIRKAEEILDYAGRNPERYGELKERMDDGKKIQPIYKDLKDLREEYGEEPEVMKEDREERQGKFNFTNENIEWAKWTWNPVTGCKLGCPYCYAKETAERFYTDMAVGKRFEPRFRQERLSIPYNMKIPESRQNEAGIKNVFVCSMGELFGEWVPDDWTKSILKVCKETPQWNYIFLTKNPEKLVKFAFSENCWVGATIDGQDRVERTLKAMGKVKAKVRFISCEPLREKLDFRPAFPPLKGIIDWVIVGGQRRTTNCDEFQPEWEWVRDLEAHARSNGCSVYFKPNLALMHIRPREHPSAD